MSRAQLPALLALLLLVACQGKPEAAPDEPAERVVSPDSPAMRVNQVTIGMTREQVLDIMGPADWVTLPTDTGRNGLFEGQTLELRWRQDGCSPVLVAFNVNGHVSLADDGFCREDAPVSQDPSEELSCEQAEREALCRP